MVRRVQATFKICLLLISLGVFVQHRRYLLSPTGFLVEPIHELSDENVNTNAAVKSEVAQAPPDVRLKHCNDTQLEALRLRFYTPVVKERNNPTARKMKSRRFFHTPLMRLTSCPQESWLDQYFAASTKESFLGINVGCNKGLDAVAMARLLSRNEGLQPLQWKEAMRDQASPVCRMPNGIEFPPNTAVATKGKVHCIEPMPSTVESLRGALDQLRGAYSDHIVVKGAAMSNISGTVLFPSGSSGVESFSMTYCHQNLNATNESECARVPMYSLDDYYLQEIASDSDYKDKDIDILMVDAEGFDYEILQGGSSEALRRTRYVLFEVNTAGAWPTHSVIEAVHTKLKDFNCYWAGKGLLWRITDCVDYPDLRELYDMISWSNIACVRRSETKLARIMEELFEKSLF